MLQAVIDTARAVFGARAASVALHDPEADELVIAAVSGEGADTMPGRRVPASAGIAGWVLAAGQPLVVEDVAGDPRFSASFARSTGYVPEGIMAAPVLGEGGAIGVVSMLDRPRRPEFGLLEVELLERFCHLVALALGAERDAGGVEDGGPLADMAAALSELSPRRRAAAERLIDALAGLLES
jgi:GAF domain-containing protein